MDRQEQERKERGLSHFNASGSHSLNVFPAQHNKELIGWLVPVQHNAKHEEASSRWKGTERFTWIVENPTFTHWRSDGGFVWLYGIRAYFSCSWRICG